MADPLDTWWKQTAQAKSASRIQRKLVIVSGKATQDANMGNRCVSKVNGNRKETSETNLSDNRTETTGCRE